MIKKMFLSAVPKEDPAAEKELAEKLVVQKTADAKQEIITESNFITDYDLYLFREGSHTHLYEKLGAHLIEQKGQKGVHFAVWAPNASRVSVVGDFNNWDGNRHIMSPLGESGIWQIFIQSLTAAQVYKYELLDHHSRLLPLKADPFAFSAEHRPATASRVWKLPKISTRSSISQTRRDPVSIYEVHLGSWRRADGDRYLTYSELADILIPYVKDMGFTHIELMPIAEFPFDGSWGYQPVGLFAPTSRFGTPDEFLSFLERAHQENIGVLLDWVPGHFPDDAHGLSFFDGTHLYEHQDPREGKHKDWDTLIYNYGRTEVANFLISNALFWFDRYGIDGLRVDAVASMIYRNYSRKEGEWLPNKHGGVENIEATTFLRRTNELVFGNFPHATTVAEESTAWPGVSQPTYAGGLGFGFKWNMGWMHDTLKYMSENPVHRKYHHNKLTFGLIYAFSENFVLPLSHDEVVHGKGSLLGRMPGDEWQRFANLRAYYGFMFTHPGKKLLFMGSEIAPYAEWNHDQSLDWHLLQYPVHKGIQNLVRDLNHLYKQVPSLHIYDCEPQGFEWLESDAADVSVLAYMRRGEKEGEIAIIVCNFTPVVRYDYRIGVPLAGFYEEKLNTDSHHYGGSNVGNNGGKSSDAIPHYTRPHSLSLTLPPLATIVLLYRGHS